MPPFRRVPALLCLVLLAACGDASPSGNATAPLPPPAVEDGRAECAIGPGAAWARDCLIERDGDEAILIMRHPDGGFRRLRIVTDGRGVVPADGAEAARVMIAGDRSIEISVGDDRYRLPATIAAPAR